MDCRSEKVRCCFIVVGTVVPSLTSRSSSSSLSTSENALVDAVAAWSSRGLNIHLVPRHTTLSRDSRFHAYALPPRHSTFFVRSASSREELCEQKGRTLVTHGERGRASARCLRTRARLASRRAAPFRCVALRCVALRCAALRCVESRRRLTNVFASARATVPFHPLPRDATPECVYFTSLVSFPHTLPRRRCLVATSTRRGSIRARYH